MRTIIFIFFLLVVSFVILMPPQLQLGKTTLYRPQIDFSLGASRIFRDLNFKLGLDLQGGTHLSYEANFDHNRRCRSFAKAE
jgi:preprotein translocase subunit SecD